MKNIFLEFMNALNEKAFMYGFIFASILIHFSGLIIYLSF